MYMGVRVGVCSSVYVWGCVCTCRGQRKVLGDLLYYSMICFFEAQSLTEPGAHDLGLGWHIATFSHLPVSVPIGGSYLAFMC